ncbi:hypothetical protein [Algoriphagus yeomjeoni]|uniref:Uncharacterized protein n=1 Tax=Algoriphagus yeomjeoni TaxID=291403 RepID=A0A327P3G0_9BACT|nr:hypothetical protein [Algoriphagus yeomjeoni]RAI86809.1 hypothetical protein LV83_03366 [Algoriphagus yeomjeoni]
MKNFLLNILPRVKTYSKELDIMEDIIDKPWVWITDNIAKEKLIFRRGGSLLMVQDGNVKEGKWELISSMKSILIDRTQDKILMNYAFFDKSVILLRKDGSENDIFAFVNEIEIPNLDYTSYLNDLLIHKNNSISENQKLISFESSRLSDESNIQEKPNIKLNFTVNNFNEYFRVYIIVEESILPDSPHYYGMLQANMSRYKVYIQGTGELLKSGLYKNPVYYRKDYEKYFEEFPESFSHLNNVYYYVNDGLVLGTYETTPIDYVLDGKNVNVYPFKLIRGCPEDYNKNSLKFALVLHKGSLKPVETGRYKTSWIESWTIIEGIIIVDGWF